ncbi:L,D-transpeptidase family protein [Sphingomonas lutea]|uniref:L,D-transpeptidase family protein n=1 Tax=Sphingomonas lutea TaxID=1045317 RepID=A0A7G9SFS8_9SPHN|nr:L,D-transpeptidase family protein [Sphingomonas lutea]QNN66703.1 L,D-transpeptidase family protein [Sphingomonas lutea]
MTFRKTLLALSALTVPAAAAAQYGMPWPAPPPPPMPMPIPRAPVAEPWQVRPQPFPQQQQQRRAQPRGDASRAPALEPIDLPPAIEQGVDMIYIDEELVPRAALDKGMLHDISMDEWSGAPVDMFVPVNPIYTDLRRGLVRYQQRWADLPQIAIPAGPSLKAGATGERVSLLRQRLGLAPGGNFDAALAAQVKEFQQVHGLKADGVAGAGTIDALNRGARYYEQLVMINMERAKRLPAPQEQSKYAVVDSGGARLLMYENGRVVDSMKVIVGAKATATPMMAAYIRFASVNPYWNVPPELVTNLIGPRVVAQGVSYLTDREYQVLSDWSENPRVLDPHTIDWNAVVAGRQEVRLRRLPSPANSMGMVKYMLPNYFGIYLHDTPEKSHFAKGDQWISNGCVRLEDAQRFGRWLFGSMPKGSNPKVEEDIHLPQPVPVYMTYLTAAATPNGIQFRADPYGKDAHLMERFGSRMVAGRR